MKESVRYRLFRNGEYLKTRYLYDMDPAVSPLERVAKLESAVLESAGEIILYVNDLYFSWSPPEGKWTYYSIELAHSAGLYGKAVAAEKDYAESQKAKYNPYGATDAETAKQAVYAQCLKKRVGESTLRERVQTGKEIGFYHDTSYYIPDGLLTDEEDWAAFEEGERRAISYVVGYEVRLSMSGYCGNGHGAWAVSKL